MWDNDEFARLVLYQEGNRKKSWKIISPTLTGLSERTWNVQVQKEIDHVVELYHLQEKDLQ